MYNTYIYICIYIYIYIYMYMYIYIYTMCTCTPPNCVAREFGTRDTGHIYIYYV